MFKYETLDIFFSTIPNFIVEAKDEIEELCSIYFRQVEAFLEKFLCTSKVK